MFTFSPFLLDNLKNILYEKFFSLRTFSPFLTSFQDLNISSNSRNEKTISKIIEVNKIR